MFDFKLVILIFAVILFVFRISGRKSLKKEPASFKMNGYHAVYSDTRPENKEENIEYGTLLKSERYDIQGKPDFVFKSNFGKSIVPVEIKSGLIKDEKEPHLGDIMQLAAYFAITEEEYGCKVKFGKIIYKDYMFTVYNTTKLRKELLKTVKAMRQMLDGKSMKIESEYIKCRHCVCRGTVCEFCEK